MSVHPLPITLVAAVSACWSAPPPAPPAHVASSASAAPDDATLTADITRLATYLGGKGEPFTSVELVGFTANNGIVYRSAICDPDELGGRGAYCTVEVCIVAPGPKMEGGGFTPTPGADAHCEWPVSETVDDPSGTFDPDRAIAATRAAEASLYPTTVGRTEAPSVVTIASAHPDVSVTAPTWFGPTRWSVLKGSTDPNTDEPFGFTAAAIASVRSSDDGTCLAFTGTALRKSRYESVVGSIRVAFAARRCRPSAH